MQILDFGVKLLKQLKLLRHMKIFIWAVSVSREFSIRDQLFILKRSLNSARQEAILNQERLAHYLLCLPSISKPLG
jgi:hypothetical protein